MEPSVNNREKAGRRLKARIVKMDDCVACDIANLIREDMSIFGARLSAAKQFGLIWCGWRRGSRFMCDSRDTASHSSLEAMRFILPCVPVWSGRSLSPTPLNIMTCSNMCARCLLCDTRNTMLISGQVAFTASIGKCRWCAQTDSKGERRRLLLHAT
jgi:hypothetical protein